MATTTTGKGRRRRQLRSYFPVAVLLIFVPSLLPVVASASIPRFLGISPEDEKYFTRSAFACKDGSKIFDIDRLNDDFCDCSDGTDEPGTSACPESKFYCRNAGDTPRFLFSSRVNDQICDCCDGSDEYDEGFICPNTCRGDHSVSNDGINDFKLLGVGNNNVHGNKSPIDLDDLFQKLRGLKVLMIMELGALMSMIYFCLFCRRIRSRRRHYLLQK